MCVRVFGRARWCACACVCMCLRAWVRACACACLCARGRACQTELDGGDKFVKWMTLNPPDPAAAAWGRVAEPARTGPVEVRITGACQRANRSTAWRSLICQLAGGH